MDSINTTEKIIITIIIPAYNVGSYIDRCLKSVLNQDIKVPYNVIVVDDGSKDDTWQKLLAWSKAYPNIITAIHKENGGQSSARNIALDLANGQYIAFVDCDDYIECDYLSVLLKLAIDTDSDISMCVGNRCKSDDGKGPIFSSGFNHNFITTDIDSVLSVSSFAPWGKLYKSFLFENLRFPLGITYEDFALIPQVMHRAKRISYIHTVLYHYFVNENSTIMSKGKITDRNIIKAQRILEETSIKNNPYILECFYIRRVIESMCFSLMGNNEDYELAKDLIEEGLRKYPSMKTNKLIEQYGLVNKTYIKLAVNEHFILAYCWARLYYYTKHTALKLRKICRK